MKAAATVWGDEEDHFYEKAAVKFVREFEGWGGFNAEEMAAEEEEEEVEEEAEGERRRKRRPGSPM